MKKTIALILTVYLFAFASCKKSTPSPSIIGAWKFTNITGTVVSTGNPSVYDTSTYSFNGSDSAMAMIRHNSEPFIFDTVVYKVSSENWSFNADGTYTITEIYSGNGFTTVTNTVTGVWEYLSNTKANDGLILTGATSSVLPSVSRDNNSYAIQTLSSKALTLTVTNSQNSSVGTVASNNIVIAFARQ